MPKYIEGLDKKILVCAEKHFRNKAYHIVSMRQIAKEMDIAVGTLYNYYSNKRELFTKVIEVWWQNSFKELNEIAEKNLASEEKIRQSLKIIFGEIIHLRSIREEMLKNEYDKEPYTFKDKKEHHKNMKSIIKPKIDSFMKNLFLQYEKENNYTMTEYNRKKIQTTIILTFWHYMEKDMGIIEIVNHAIDLLNAYYLYKNHKEENRYGR